jgi:hypothetical protein
LVPITFSPFNISSSTPQAPALIQLQLFDEKIAESEEKANEAISKAAAIINIWWVVCECESAPPLARYLIVHKLQAQWRTCMHLFSW